MEEKLKGKQYDCVMIGAGAKILGPIELGDDVKVGANAVPMPVLAAALFGRFASRQENSPQMQAVAALRGQFGGHEVMQFGREPWRAAKEGQAEVSGAAEPKKDAGAARPGAAPNEH